MDVIQKLETLAVAAKYDICGYDAVRSTQPRERVPYRFIYRATLPGGKCVSLLKILLTNICTNDCVYCSNWVGRDFPRTYFRPHELANLFMEFYRKGLVHGLFLSSGIAGSSSQTMQNMIDTVEILRRHYEYKGYVHLKVMPGAGYDCVEAACRVANRVSINIEAPTASHLAQLSSHKDLHNDIIERMRWIKQAISTNSSCSSSGQTTQFVVGAAGETDRDILRTMAALYREMGLKRIYFSAFQPMIDTPLEGREPTPPMREFRLYQVDSLLRIYGFSLPEVEAGLNPDGNLPLTKDPKMVIAKRRPWLFPVDVNRAGFEELIRVPGIGPISARRIIAARAEHSINSVEQLKKMGVVIKRASAFIWFRGASAYEKQTCFLQGLDNSDPEELSLLAGAFR